MVFTCILKMYAILSCCLKNNQNRILMIEHPPPPITDPLDVTILLFFGFINELDY